MARTKQTARKSSSGKTRQPQLLPNQWARTLEQRAVSKDRLKEIHSLGVKIYNANPKAQPKIAPNKRICFKKSPYSRYYFKGPDASYNFMFEQSPCFWTPAEQYEFISAAKDGEIECIIITAPSKKLHWKQRQKATFPRRPIKTIPIPKKIKTIDVSDDEDDEQEWWTDDNGREFYEARNKRRKVARLSTSTIDSDEEIMALEQEFDRAKSIPAADDEIAFVLVGKKMDEVQNWFLETKPQQKGNFSEFCFTQMENWMTLARQYSEAQTKSMENMQAETERKELERKRKWKEFITEME